LRRSRLPRLGNLHIYIHTYLLDKHNKVGYGMDAWVCKKSKDF
jgi:hypothetical protein